jgi:hypothetical protein
MLIGYNCTLRKGYDVKELIELIFGPEAEIAESWRRYEDNRPRRKQIELAFE